jgi:transposase
VAAVARDLGVGWATIMRAVGDHGTQLVEDPTRLDGVAALGLDETSFLKATRPAPTRWVTGLVDLEGGRLLDLVADRTRAAVGGWLDARPHDGWPRSARSSWTPGAGTPARWSSHSVMRPWLWTLSCRPAGQHGGRPDRRRVQQAILSHRGRRVTRCTASASCC